MPRCGSYEEDARHVLYVWSVCCVRSRSREQTRKAEPSGDGHNTGGGCMRDGRSPALCLYNDTIILSCCFCSSLISQVVQLIEIITVQQCERRRTKHRAPLILFRGDPRLVLHGRRLMLHRDVSRRVHVSQFGTRIPLHHLGQRLQMICQAGVQHAVFYAQTIHNTNTHLTIFMLGHEPKTAAEKERSFGA